MGLTISVVGHAAALLWAVVTFGVTPHNAIPPDSLPIDIISAKEFSAITAGTKTAKVLAPAPKPVVEKVAERKPAEDNPATKVTEKPEIITASAQTPEPPTPKPPEPKPTPKAEAKPEAKPQEAEKKPEAKPEAESLKKDEAKKPEPKKEEAKVAAPKKPPPPKPLDFKNIEQKLALLDKREGQRHAYAGETLNSTPTLGTRTGNAPTLSQNELDALRARLAQCWNPPAGVVEAKNLNVEVQMMLRQDGSLSAEPKVLNHSTHPLFQIAAESALRAIRTCAPFNFLPVAKFEIWKDIDIVFNPESMFRS
jgi:colicin import membrane protein